MHLSAARANIGVSVLCPGYVKTKIMDSVRTGPRIWQATTHQVLRTSNAGTATLRTSFAWGWSRRKWRRKPLGPCVSSGCMSFRCSRSSRSDS